MGFSLAKQRVSPIVVDFGGDSLKLLQVMPEHPPQLAAAAMVVVPENVRQDVQARLAFYETALRKLLKKQPFKGRRAMLAIPAQHMLMQNIEVAASDAMNAGQQVDAHLRDRLAMEPTQMVVRHFEVGQVIRDGANFNEIVCLAAPRAVVIRYLNLARQCKLDVVGMHSVPQTILRAFGQLDLRGVDTISAVAYIDIGATSTTVVIAHGDKMVFAKKIQAGGDQMNQQYAQVNDVSFDDARDTRLRIATDGSPQPTATSSATTAAVLDVPANSSCEPAAVDCLVDELKLCMRYYQGRFSQIPIEKLVFIGGESRHTAICQRIARTLRIAAQLGDPFATLIRTNNSGQSISVDLNQPQPGWAVPYGLCWSEANL